MYVIIPTTTIALLSFTLSVFMLWTSRQVHDSRYVIFDESCFPFAYSQSDHPSLDSLLDGTLDTLSCSTNPAALRQWSFEPASVAASSAVDVEQPPHYHMRAGPSGRRLVPSSGSTPSSPVALALEPDVCGPVPLSGSALTLLLGRRGFMPLPRLPPARTPRGVVGFAPSFPLMYTRQPAMLAPVPTPMTLATFQVPTPSPTASAPAPRPSS